MLKFSINFKEILSRAHGNFEKQNMPLDSSMNYLLLLVILLLLFILLLLYYYY